VTAGDPGPADEATRHNQATYDSIAARYAQHQATLPQRAFGELRAAFTARLPPGAVVADLGCGTGEDARLFTAAGYRVIGADRSAGMLAITARQLPGRVVQADLRQLPLASASLDGIWCCAALLHVPPEGTAAALAGMRRILRHGSPLALVTALGNGARLEPVPYAPQQRRWFFYRQAPQLREQLHAAGLTVLSMTSQPTTRHWARILAIAA
jgi:ubiquinone/menaquinone biosynthesis C-methylase UbiE